MAATTAAPPTSPIRAPCRISEISSAGLNHPLPHDGLGDVDQSQAWDSAGDLRPQQSGDVVVLDPEPAPTNSGVGQHGGNGMFVVVPLPVGVDEVVTEAAPPGLAGVDVRGDGGVGVLSDDQGVVPAERSEQEVAVVVDVVIAGEQHRVDAGLGHFLTQRGDPAFHFLDGKGGMHLVAIVNGLESFEVHLVLLAVGPRRRGSVLDGDAGWLPGGLLCGVAASRSVLGSCSERNAVVLVE